MARAEYEYDPKTFEDRYGEDAKVWVKFYLNLVEDQAKSAEAGRPVFTEKEYVEIRSPGNETNIINRPVSDIDRNRFPRHYKMFKEGITDTIIGTPLSEMLWIKRTTAEELKHLKIITVEHLASVTDEVCGRMTGLYDLKAKANAYLENVSKPDVQSLMQRIADLEAKLADVEAEEE
jgi:hypothetical protein